MIYNIPVHSTILTEDTVVACTTRTAGGASNMGRQRRVPAVFVIVPNGSDAKDPRPGPLACPAGDPRGLPLLQHDRPLLTPRVLVRIAVSLETAIS